MKKLPVLLMFVFSVSLILALSSTAIATSDKTYVYGKVYDIETNQGIPGVKVTAQCIDTGDTKKSFKTGDDGNYVITSLKCSVTNTVTVTAIKDKVVLGSNEGIVVECNDQLSMCSSPVHVGITEIKIGIPEYPLAILPVMLTMLSFGLVSRRF